MKKVAVIVAGCGAKDGSEITESVATLIALSEQGVKYDIFAPNRPSASLANHLTDEENQKESRNLLVEAARIARGNIKALDHINLSHYDAICFPGGFGAAKNLCNFAFAGAQAKLHDDIKDLLDRAVSAKKVIGALCIAPMLLAIYARDKHLKNVMLTLGPKETDPVKLIESWGLKHQACQTHEVCLDHTYKFSTAPAYMWSEALPHEILKSAQAMVRGMKDLM